MSTSNTTQHIVVIGAGVTALEIARQLLLAPETKNAQVTIVAERIPGEDSGSEEFCSPWAGGHWRTHASSRPEDERLRRWDLETLEFWNSEMERERLELAEMGLGEREQFVREGKGRGLKVYEQYHFFNSHPTADPHYFWWSPYVPDFRALSQVVAPVSTLSSTGENGNVVSAVACRSIAVNVPRYLQSLLEDVKRSPKVRIVKARIDTSRGWEAALADVERLVSGVRVDVFVNATGLGARLLCGDVEMFPVRGQTVLVRGEADAIRHQIGDDFEAYVIPRPGSGTTVLGGTKEKGSWVGEVDARTTGNILRRCRGLAPELLSARAGGTGGEFEVLSVQCGLRPARKGGPRIERETVGTREVVHAYGHAGAGFQNSYGCAKDVVRLVVGGLGGSPAPVAKL